MISQEFVNRVTSENVPSGGDVNGPPSKGPLIRGRDLKITESDVLGSLPFFKRVHAFLFGGVFGIHDGTTRKNAKGEDVRGVVIAFVPSLWRRIYFKYLYKHSVGVKE